MKSSLFTILIIIIAAFCNISAQSPGNNLERSTNTISFNTGISSYSVRDEMMSPLIYRGKHSPIELTYQYEGADTRHTVTLYYGKNDLSSTITNSALGLHYIKNLNLSFEYSYAAKLASLSGINGEFFIGGRLSSMLNMRTHYFIQGNSHQSAEQMTGIGIYLLTEFSLQKESNNIISLGINIPFVTYALLTDRFNANVSEDFNNLNYEENVLWQLFKNGKIISFNKLFELQAELSCRYFINNFLGFALKYKLQYYSFEQYENLLHANVFNNQFLIGITVKL